jgi:ATP-grasp domain, R2K clade family 2
MLAYIQYRRGLPATEGCYASWLALEYAGWEIRPFESHEEIVVDPDHVVIGGIPNVVGALTRLGLVLPDVDYPEPLRSFLLDPDVRVTTMGAVRTERDAWPVFAKPVTGRKEFTGLVVRTTNDLLRVTHVDDATPVFSMKPTDLSGRVEWRAYVIDGLVRDVRPYLGCADTRAPGKTFVQMLANQWSSIPSGCSIDVVDVGTERAPDWRVIECNDGYSLGSYGFFRMAYAELLVRRWGELTGSDVRFG